MESHAVTEKDELSNINLKTWCDLFQPKIRSMHLGAELDPRRIKKLWESFTFWGNDKSWAKKIACPKGNPAQRLNRVKILYHITIISNALHVCPGVKEKDYKDRLDDKRRQAARVRQGTPWIEEEGQVTLDEL